MSAQRFGARVVRPTGKGIASLAAIAGLEGVEGLPKPNKYNAKKVVIDDIVFDSTVEGEFYQHLKFLQRAGEVLRFELQPVFPLIAGFKKFSPTLGKTRTWRKRWYQPDFRVWFADGRVLIIDVKGYKTEAFSLKQCLFESLYPDLEVVLVTKKGRGWTYWQ